MRKVIFRSPFIPEEYIAAHKLTPVRFVPDSAFSNDPIPDKEGVCPYMRDFINEASATEDTLIILTTICDQMRHGFNLLQKSNGNKSFLFNLPSTWQSDESFSLFQSELERLGRFLVRNGGHKPTDSELIEVMLAYDSNRTNAEKRIVVSDKQLPVGVIGGPLSCNDRKIIDLIEEMSGVIVFDGTETGERTRPAVFDRIRIIDGPMLELTKAYFGTIPDVFRRPNRDLFCWLKERITERQPKGVLLVRQVWCDLWHAEVQRLRDSLDIPLLDLDMNGDDAITRNRTRISAFMEMLR